MTDPSGPYFLCMPLFFFAGIIALAGVASSGGPTCAADYGGGIDPPGSLLKQLAIASKSTGGGGGGVVVLAERDKEEIEMDITKLEFDFMLSWLHMQWPYDRSAT